MNRLAQIPLYTGDKLEGKGALGLEGKPASTAPSIFTTTISAFVGILTVVAFIYFLFLLLIGGVAWMTAGGDKAKLAEARGRMTSGLIGLVIVISAIFIVRLLADIAGIDFFNIGLSAVINQIAPPTP